MTDNDEKLDELARRFHAGEAASRPPVAGTVNGAAPPGTLDDDAATARERDDLRGTLLARSLARRRGYGVPAAEKKMRARLSSWALALIALLAAWSLWGVFPELRYWLSAQAPLDLGRLGAYQPLDALPDGALVRLEGVASPKRGTYSRFLREHEVFPLIASRLLIDRVATPDPALRGYGFRYSGEGRLSRAGARYQGVRDQFVQAGELAKSGEVWVLEDGVVPRRGLRVPLEALLWGGVVAFAVVTLLSRAARRS